MSGRVEYPDATPVEVPLGFKRPPTLQEEIQRLIRIQMSQMAVDSGLESFEEANDFDVDDDPDPLSHYEVAEMQDEEFAIKETEDGKADGGGAAVRESVPKAGGKDVSAESGSDRVSKPEGSSQEGRGAGAAGSK